MPYSCSNKIRIPIPINTKPPKIPTVFIEILFTRVPKKIPKQVKNNKAKGIQTKV